MEPHERDDMMRRFIKNEFKVSNNVSSYKLLKLLPFFTSMIQKIMNTSLYAFWLGFDRNWCAQKGHQHYRCFFVVSINNHSILMEVLIYFIIILLLILVSVHYHYLYYCCYWYYILVGYFYCNNYYEYYYIYYYIIIIIVIIIITLIHITNIILNLVHPLALS